MSCCSDLIKDVFPKADSKCFSDGTVVEENKRKFTVKWERKGERTLCKIKVDGCLIPDQTKNKCDFAFMICPEKRFLFVELKGTDIEHGIKQLLDTITFFRSKTAIPQDSISGYIVSSAVPSNSNQKIREAQMRFKKFIGRELIVKNNHCEHVLK